MGLNGGPKYKFSPVTSFVIECDTQEEIDYYWDNLGKDVVYNQCSWLDDQHGISWQTVPTILGQLMSNPEKSQKVIVAFLKMTKFDIATLINS